MLIGSIEASRGSRDAAAEARRAALREAEALAAREPRDAELRRLLASAHVAMTFSLTGVAERLEAWTAAGDIFEALLREEPHDHDRMRNVALVDKYVGTIHLEQKRAGLAEPRFRRALQLDEQRLAATPKDRQAQFDVAIDLANVANLLARRKAVAEALALYDRSVGMREAMVRSDPGDVQGRVALARALHITAGWRYAFEEFAGARRDIDRAIAVAGPLVAATQEADVTLRLVRALTLRARLHQRDRRRAHACGDLRRAADVLATIPAAQRPNDDRAALESVGRAVGSCR
jgi:tetratricopeptide (TPR) repeat protein